MASRILAARSASFGTAGVNFAKVPDHLVQVLVFLVAEVSCLILLSKLFGCRMRMLKMIKAQIKAPAVLALFMTLGVYLLPTMALIFQPLVFMGAGALCAPSIHAYTAQYIVGKLLLFGHLIERFHATRACRDCYLGVGWSHRLKGDCVWCMLMIVGIAGTVGILFSSSVLVGSHFDPAELVCVVNMPHRVLVAEFVWITLFYILLVVVFFWIMLCTVNHFQNVRDIPDWQYKLRQRVLRATPKLLNALGAKTGAGGKHGQQSCPAYLCPLEAETAGSLENLAIKGSIAALLSLLPTLANFTQLFVHGGIENSWIYAMVATLDVTFQALIMHILSTYPGDRGEQKLAASIKKRDSYVRSPVYSTPAAHPACVVDDSQSPFWPHLHHVDDPEAALANPLAVRKHAMPNNTICLTEPEPAITMERVSNWSEVSSYQTVDKAVQNGGMVGKPSDDDTATTVGSDY